MLGKIFQNFEAPLLLIMSYSLNYKHFALKVKTGFSSFILCYV